MVLLVLTLTTTTPIATPTPTLAYCSPSRLADGSACQLGAASSPDEDACCLESSQCVPTVQANNAAPTPRPSPVPTAATTTPLPTTSEPTTPARRPTTRRPKRRGGRLLRGGSPRGAEADTEIDTDTNTISAAAAAAAATKNMGVCVRATRILFVGNSFTIRNNLPGMVQSLASAANRLCQVSMSASGSMTFQAHSQSQATLFAIYSKSWDAVVLQEQSFFLATSIAREQMSVWPYAKQLVDAVKVIPSRRAILLETWGYASGDPGRAGLSDTYAKMQDRLLQGYSALQAYLNPSLPTELALAGEAWRLAVNYLASIPNGDIMDLYSDGQHPSPWGTYIAACVVYGHVFRASPVGNSFRPTGVSPAQAKLAQSWAKQVLSL